MTESFDSFVFYFCLKFFAMYLMNVRRDSSAATENFLLFRKVVECSKKSLREQIEMVEYQISQFLVLLHC